MPYKTIDDLPPNVKDVLPTHAREIYMKAFNNALKQYQDPSKRRGNESAEETAHKVAWDAVKTKYQKDSSGNWVEK